jgi:hypothetical protein
MLNTNVRFEQAVYGSFPFWNRGYAVLARSAGCRPEWIAALKTACQRYGERPAGVPETDGLFVLKLEDGRWMVVGVYPQGCDDLGRPGALAFHALFVGPRIYWLAGATPFVFTPLLRRNWSCIDLDAALPARGNLRWRQHDAEIEAPAIGADDERLAPGVAALLQGRRVIVKSAQPIDSLAQGIWRALPRRVRCRASLATWAFNNANHFDLVALPKLAAISLDESALILAI